MNVLAMMANARDVAWFCGGTLLKYIARGDNVYIALATGEKAPAGWDVPVRLLGFREGLLCDGMAERAAVLTAMRWAEADVILTPSPWDADPDRVNTCKLVCDSLLIMAGKLHPADLPPVNKRPSVFYCDTMGGRGQPNRYGQRDILSTNWNLYLTPGVYSNDLCQPECYVDITAHMDEKLALIDPAQREAAAVQNQLRGIQVGSQYAEGYSAHRISGNFADFRKLP